MLEQRYSDNEVSRRDIPSFIEPRPPLIQNPFMRPRPQKGTNLLELFEEDSEIEEPELVQVYLRLKPCRVPNTLYEVRSDKCLVTSLDTATAGHGRRTQHNVSKMYTFSKIFGAECDQKEIFESVVKDNLKKLPDGQNFTLLTYGASGSGKTYTLMGTVGAPGLVPRSLEYVFRLVDAAQQPAFRPAENGAEKLNHVQQDYELQWVKRLRHVSAPLREKYRRMSAQLNSDLTVSSIDLSNRIRHYVWVSFVEIYNEAIYDLLAPPEKRSKLRIREDNTGNVYVKGATQAFVRSGEEAYDVMVAGRHNLVVAATGVHAQSSRSHCIFTITMLTETGSGGVRSSCVRLCDLAGCERARATRNTGARMLESRAINSSLHVLERCLHMLRRKQRAGQDALVPYRESKLTRLLGTGLSGARGEAVSMVVTLNPAPQYAHETKHVLTLAAVAQDIQINNTMYASTLESSAQETTISCSSSEVMKLRSDNERLHFELVQAQARNKELLASMEERQQESANTMRELVEEAKDLTKQYYEAQLEALRCEMEDMVEEYESRLAKVPTAPPATGTPSRFLQAKVAQLMTEIAVLEEKLTAESLARARAEKEVQHLRTCIEERDEKAFKDTTPPREDVMSLSDSEQESDEEPSDPFNESLEPVFKKDQNRSILAAHKEKQNDTTSIHTIDNIDEECDSDLEKSHDTLKNYSKNSTGDDEDDVSKTVDESKVDDVKNASITYNSEVTESKYEDSLKSDSIKDMSTDDANDSANNDVQFKNDSKSIKMDLRGTYFVSESKISNDSNSLKETARGTYFVKDSLTDVSKNGSEFEQNEVGNVVFKDPIAREKSKLDITTENQTELVVNQIYNEKSTLEVPERVLNSSDIMKQKSELKQSNKLESKLVREKSKIDMKLQEIPEFHARKIVREKSDIQKKDIENVTPNVVREKSAIDIKISSKDLDIESEIKDKNTEVKVTKDDSEPQWAVPEKLPEIIPRIAREKSNSDLKGAKKVPEAIVNKIIRSFKSNHGSDASLRQFEQLEEAAKDCPDETNQSTFGDIKTLPKKRTYFDNLSVDDAPKRDVDEVVEKVAVEKEKRTFFDNIDLNVEKPNKRVNELMNNDDERSPSIVKESVISDDFEPNTIKKLLGESFTKPEIITSAYKARMNKKHNSVDIFDGFDSPLTAKTKEKADNVEIARQSIEKLVLERSVKKPEPEPILFVKEIIKPVSQIKQEIKLEPVSSMEEDDENKQVAVGTKLEAASSLDETNQTMNKGQENGSENNTIEDFENIYKDLTAPRATEFELLVQDNNTTNNTSTEKNEKEEIKYNLRKKTSKVDESKTTSNDEEILAESHAKCESKGRKRTLRLRKKKNQEDESDEKLKDIVNLQSEFSDVTLDRPAPTKVIKDIPSPVKGLEENLPPLMGIQSCPSKRQQRNSKRSLRARQHAFET
ncbi:kinesin-like protein cut7 isoform X2 [Trichoplusia ni]|uniref:Kinesin-like protein cut7 isoform X2 n=1 Tax=Trichoplusia ni TaxID=7111 RepID=A0A7E5W6W8_TRINI|nr:kinesin-like protein cut7 isoform X2 [Trichoplusia ni]